MGARWLLFTFVVSMVVWYALKYTMGVRVKPEEEMEGLDLHEIGVEAYNADPLGGRRAAAPEAAQEAAIPVATVQKPA